MTTVDRLLAHPHFLALFDRIAEKERTRRFCCHGLDHALDVARITWILSLEAARPFEKETVYLAALLHDIGRAETDADHDTASVHIARALLADCGAAPVRIEEISAAISCHRAKDVNIDPATASLGELLALADKKSRLCFRCAAAHDCHWPEALKNHTITY